MKSLLDPGMPIHPEQYDNASWSVESLIGQGGQGEVYVAKAQDGPRTERYALKWYYASWATDSQRRLLKELTDNNPPHASFLWPRDVVVCDRPGFGYLMDLRPDRFVQLSEIMSLRVRMTQRALVTAAANLSHAFLCLHAQGLCYRDISFGNLFIDPVTSEILVADNDNVGIDGQAEIGVRGTENFMAPEIVRGEAIPSTRTDLWSLAVLIFYLFVMHHPLDGRREAAYEILDREAKEDLHGTNPLFIFDPRTDANAPLPGVHDNAIAYWPILPPWFRDYFVRSFTDGATDPDNGRVRETEWRAALVNLREHVLVCVCQAEVFWDKDSPTGTTCWNCGSEVHLPPKLVLLAPTGPEAVLLTASTAISASRLQQGEFSMAADGVTVSAHPEHPDIVGLKNESPRVWQVHTPDGRQTVVAPGRSVRLVDGMTVDFGTLRGRVEV